MRTSTLWTLGDLKTPQIVPELTEAASSYENPAEILGQTHKLQVATLDQTLGGFPSGWEPAAWQQARDANTTEM